MKNRSTMPQRSVAVPSAPVTGTAVDDDKSLQNADFLAVLPGENRDSYGLRIAATLVGKAREIGGRETNVYFVQAGPGGPIKVGIADDPYKRLAALQTGNSEQLILRGFYPAPAALEGVIHRAFAEDRLTGEWFVGTETLEVLADTLFEAAIQHGMVVLA